MTTPGSAIGASRRARGAQGPLGRDGALRLPEIVIGGLGVVGGLGVLGGLSVLAMIAAALPAWLARGVVVLHQCVAGDGVVGHLGMGLALVRSSTDCPAGTLALGGAQRQVITVVVSVAAPVLVAHLLTAATGLAVVALLRRSAGLLRALLRVWRPSPISSGLLPRGELRGPFSLVVPLRARQAGRWAAHLTRGPPLAFVV